MLFFASLRHTISFISGLSVKIAFHITLPPSPLPVLGNIAIIQKSIRDTFPDRTLMLVTHRASLLKSVENLLVLDGGVLVAEGPRDSVLDAITEGRVPAVESNQ